jgi:prolyl-tRNA synthetase
VSRLVGAIIEANHDQNGIIWPEEISPFDVTIVNLKQGDLKADQACNYIYTGLLENGLDPLYDDRQERAGVKFASMDLIGIPWRITVGPRSLENETVELTNRRTGETQNISLDKIIDHCVQISIKPR